MCIKVAPRPNALFNKIELLIKQKQKNKRPECSLPLLPIALFTYGDWESTYSSF